MFETKPPEVLEAFRIDIRRVPPAEPLLGPDGTQFLEGLPGCIVVKLDIAIQDEFSGKRSDAQRETFVVRLPLSAASLPIDDIERLALRSLANRLRSIADQLPALADAVPDTPPPAD